MTYQNKEIETQINKRNIECLALKRKGLSYAEMGKRFGVSRQAVHRSLKKFLKKIEEEN